MKSITGLTRMLTAMFVIAVFFIVSCKKESSTGGSSADQQEFVAATAESDAEAEVVFDDVFDNVMGVNQEVAIGGTGVFAGANKTVGVGEEALNGTNQVDSNLCFTVSFVQLASPNRFPLEVTIDFGAGCVGKDGRTRKGKIIIVYSGPLYIPGNSATTSFDGYYVNDVKVEGTHKITNQSTQDKKIFKVLVLNAKLSKPNGNYSQWTSEKTISQVEGLGTPFWPLDDVFTVEGGASGAVKKGDRFYQWATSIKEPLVKKFACRWIVKGIIVLRKSNTDVAELNYGSGQCDNKATITINGVSREISLY